MTLSPHIDEYLIVTLGENNYIKTHEIEVIKYS